MTIDQLEVTTAAQTWDLCKRINGIISRLRYRKGCELSCDVTPDGTLTISVRMTVPCSRNPGDTALIGMTQALVLPIPLDAKSDHDVALFIWRVLIEPMERHEAAEWFRLDGELVLDPHQGPAR